MKKPLLNRWKGAERLPVVSNRLVLAEKAVENSQLDIPLCFETATFTFQKA